MNLTHAAGDMPLSTYGEAVDFRILQGLKEPEASPVHHPFLENPADWLSEYREIWQSQFPERPTSEVIIGCSDPRLNGVRDLCYPGIGGYKPDLDIVAKKIIDLRKSVLPHCQIILQTHDDCGAMQRALQDHHVSHKDPDEFAELWGGHLTKRITQITGDTNIRHVHMPLRNMKKKQERMNTIYVDCTDRLQVSSELPFGPTVSLLNPKSIAFNTGISLRHLLGNGLDHHLMPDVRFMVEHLCGGESLGKHFSEKNPLTIVLVRDTKQFVISNIAQRTVEDFADRNFGRIKVLPIDQRGTIHEPLTTKTPVGLP